MKNLLKNIPEHLPKELFETLARSGDVHIERIISSGHTSPTNEWYDQTKHEFVLVLKGAAKLEFEGGRIEKMGRGDWLEIPAHLKHRVAWTDGTQETVWLAVHY
jgi:cupin 2 domain-containing protein